MSTSPSPPRCPECRAELGPSQLACPSCQRLVHGDRLRELAAAAEAFEQAGENESAIARWREALTLLPPTSAQAKKIRERILPMSQDAPAPTSRMPAWMAGLGALGLLLWKFKFALVLLLTKGKLLLLGLTKGPTLFSMFLAAQLFVREYGWPFVAGVLACIYFHEMGHVYRLRKLGIAHDDPIFIPGIGALVLMRDLHVSPRENARIGLAGPWWGLAGGLVMLGLYAATRAEIFLAICAASSWLNLFNLIPFWCLDGARGMRPLNRLQILALCALALPMLGLGSLVMGAFLVCSAWKAFTTREAGDWGTCAEFAILMVAHGLLTQVHPV